MAKDFMLANYIYSLASLPERPDVLLTTNNEKQIFMGRRYRYKAISLWLQHLLLGEELAEEAFLTDMKHYQPLAEFAAAEFRLAVGVHPRSDNPLIRNFKSPADLWFAIQQITSQKCLEHSGLTGVPLIESKRKVSNVTLQVIKDLENLSVFYQPNDIWELSAVLLLEAQKIAKIDVDFQKDYFRPHLRVMKRINNKIKNSQHLQTAYLLPNGELFWTGKHTKLPKSL